MRRRYAGIKNGIIKIISDYNFDNQDLMVVKIPHELDLINSSEIISNYKFKNNKFVLPNDIKDIKDLKIALVSNWKMTCGISTYAESLFAELIKHLNNYKLFVEKNEIVGDFYTAGNQVIPKDNIIACWNRGQSLKQLIYEIKKYDPDIVWIQHEFGLWSNACYWLSMMSQLSEYRIIVTMHSVFHHKDKTICEAAIPEIVVHLEGAYKVLKEEKGISGDVYVIPHGCYPCTNKEKLWNFYRTKHTIIQAGFLFRYKGWEESIKAIAILKEKYPDVFFTGLCSESDFSKLEHEIYFNELMDLIKTLNVEENVALIRGYQSDQTWDSYFRTNRVALFPYISHPGHEVFGASGAARLAMSKNIPVLSSSVNHFSDLPTIKADTPEQIACEISKLFDDYKLINKQLEKQNAFLQKHSWEQIALQYVKLFEGKV